jgi:hypothetical protein
VGKRRRMDLALLDSRLLPKLSIEAALDNERVIT